MPRRDQEDEGEQRERLVGAGEVEHVVEDKAADAQGRREREHHGSDQQQRRERGRAASSASTMKMTHQHDRDDQVAVVHRRVMDVDGCGGLAAHQGVCAWHGVHRGAQPGDGVVGAACES